MAAIAVIECDGEDCEVSEWFDFDCFKMGDLPNIYWNFDSNSEFYYCPICVKKMTDNGEL
jgi:hypothetical protein